MESSSQDLIIPARMTGMRIDEALAGLLPGLNRSQAQKLVRRGLVRLEGRVLHRSHKRLGGGERLQIQELPDTQPKRPRSLHEDSCLLVLEKPAGMLTHAAEPSSDWSLADLADRFWGPLSRAHGNRRPGIVHRLDRGTSGVLVVARTDSAMHSLIQQFKDHTVDKRYLAVVAGTPPSDHWECEIPVGPSPDQKDRQWLDPPEGARSAQTTFKVLERQRGLSLVECRPKTGRRHQIRLHLTASGLTLVGDPMYKPRGKPTQRTPLRSVKRMLLHSAHLGFLHPETGSSVCFQSPAPAEFRAALKAAGENY